MQSNTIIIGAGRMGSSIARYLNSKANVVVIDKNPVKIGRLQDYSGFVQSGDATDLQLLEKCGIENADSVIAVTDDDNVNIFIADLCCHIYHVNNIYIKLKDSRKKVIVDKRVGCICPFDLSLDFFEKKREGENRE